MKDYWYTVVAVGIVVLIGIIILLLSIGLNAAPAQTAAWVGPVSP